MTSIVHVPHVRLKVALRLGQAFVTVLLLVLVWRIADGPQALGVVSDLHFGWFLCGLGALTLQTLVSAQRWRLTAAQVGIILSPLHAVQEYYLAQLINQTMPGGVLGDASRAVRARSQAGLLVSGQAVVIERLAGQAAMFAILGVAFVTTWLMPGGIDWPAWLATSVVVLVGGALVLPLIALALARLPGAVGGPFRSLNAIFKQALLEPKVVRAQIGLSVCAALCNLFAFALCARALGLALPPGAVFALIPLILLTMLIPLTISGWGVREGAAVALLPLAGASASEGLATSIVFGLAFLLATMPGFVALWRNPIGQSEP
ncbi:MAG: lysylphosphatidylglycerol synthase transmembrane domain-containing protein [Pseudomonadota bacterium]